jgi:hypothetical protein
MNLNHFGKLRKVGDRLVYEKDKDRIAFEEFKKNLPEGSLVEIFMEHVHDNGTLAQLAKAHAIVRELSKHTGFTFEETKLLLKDKAGLCIKRTISGKEFLHCKSLGDCDKDELAGFIQAAINLGIELGHPVD